MNMGKRCLQSRPRGPAPKISPARKSWVHRQAVERRRCGTTLFVCSLGEPVTFSISHPPQSRHPERSAARIYRITDGLWRVVEGPRRCLLADALPSFPATDYRPNQKSHKLRAKPTCPGVPWRDLQFRGPFVELFFDRVVMCLWPTKADENQPKGRSKATTLSFTELKQSGA